MLNVMSALPCRGCGELGHCYLLVLQQARRRMTQDLIVNIPMDEKANLGFPG
jgi:hypothetical protein